MAEGIQATNGIGVRGGGHWATALSDVFQTLSLTESTPTPDAEVGGDH